MALVTGTARTLSVLALDPGVHLGYALLPEGEVGVLVLPREPVAAVRTMAASLGHLLDRADRVVVEGWEVRGRSPGKDSLVPVALLGALLALGAEAVSPRWKQRFAAGVSPRMRIEGEASSFPSGLDAVDRKLWIRLQAEGCLSLLERVRALPKAHRPHALDALGLARWTTLRLNERGVSYAF